VLFADGGEASFDHIVIATHADEALALLDAPTALQKNLLGSFRYAANAAYLHQDVRLMPRRRRLWASWNYLNAGAKNSGSITYWMNRLQSLSSRAPLLVSLNPAFAPEADKTLAHMIYTHPQFDHAALRAQSRLKDIQGQDRLWFCGSYFGYGFHEDALASGLAVAEALGAKRPWQVSDVSPAFANATPAAKPASP
jgi:predicted NAD/FAD-binding protein